MPGVVKVVLRPGLAGYGCSLAEDEIYRSVVVTQVRSPPALGQLCVNDIVLNVNGQDVRTLKYSGVIALLRATDKATLYVQRGDMSLSPSNGVAGGSPATTTTRGLTPDLSDSLRSYGSAQSQSPLFGTPTPLSGRSYAEVWQFVCLSVFVS